MKPKPFFFDLSLPQVDTHLQTLGVERYRARQLWEGMYKKLAPSPRKISNLPENLREQLEGELTFSALTVQSTLSSRDGKTEKYLLDAQDGQAIEAVLMRYQRRDTACISTQIGCGMGCVFCATGQMGFKRNLSSGEIVEQVISIARGLDSSGDRLSNVVVMGMGEPFQNYDASMEAIDRLNDPEGFNFGKRRFTISTVGLVPMIERFTKERRQANLAISLHAATNALRERMLPINRRYPLEVLMPACRAYTVESGRRVTFEWALIQGVNDGDEQAAALADWVDRMNCHVNIIPLNPTHGYEGQAANLDQVLHFQKVVEKAGISTTVRVRRGIDIQAGCGQLAVEKQRNDSQ
ncbi:MAG: 23S rRNA (adenine(2503)-C(2))-methyltransferase RlmN [Anaerolineales bacterium]|nr:23S rRNA (adenine(2503)-C(2))-methyltransferase RlmN [Anaerolineales bacterium]